MTGRRRQHGARPLRRWLPGGFVAAAVTALVVASVLAPGGDGTDRAEAPEGEGISRALLQEIVDASAEDAFATPSGPWRVALPSDYGAHPEARGETWTIAAHLSDEAGEVLGVHVSLTRFGLRAPAAEDVPGTWQIGALYRGHVAVIPGSGARVRAAERFSRGAVAAGHDAEAREVWLDDWTLSYGHGPDGRAARVTAAFGDVRLRLELEPAKTPVRIGGQDAAPLRGFALPRLDVSGEVASDGATRRVSGTAWMDRAWGELPPPGGPLAYDRLVLQLDDGTDLSLLRTRRRDGRGPTNVDGALIPPSGQVEPLSDGAATMRPADAQDAPGGSAPYPLTWRVAGDDLDLRVSALRPEGGAGFALGGWTGPVRAEGRIGDAEVTGLGTLQMTGYETQ